MWHFLSMLQIKSLPGMGVTLLLLETLLMWKICKESVKSHESGMKSGSNNSSLRWTYMCMLAYTHTVKMEERWVCISSSLKEEQIKSGSEKSEQLIYVL